MLHKQYDTHCMATFTDCSGKMSRFILEVSLLCIFQNFNCHIITSSFDGVILSVFLSGT